MTYVVDDVTPPPLEDGSIDYWERSKDPFHPSVFPFKLKIFFPIRAFFTKRKQGWMAYDWIDNPIGFIPDGTVYNCPKPNLKMGPGFAGRLKAERNN